MNVSDFDFDLPDELVAQDPPAERGGSRLLVLPRRAGPVRHSAFGRLGEDLRAGDLLVVNDTRVFPARLLGRRDPSGGAVECLLTAQIAAPEADGSVVWEGLMHPGQKLKPGAQVRFSATGAAGVPSAPEDLLGEVLERRFHGRRRIRLRRADGGSVDDAIERLGHIPLPPYIRREDRPSDRERYQTVYARERGSIAAPTAGLHFTPALLAELAARGVNRAAITLHVGYGTFKPVRVEEVEQHAVDPERFRVSREAAAAITATRQAGHRVIAVGTTTMRAIESLTVGPDGEVTPADGEARLFIHPGHVFRVADGLITNFHLPRSSLLMLVAAFAGTERTLAAYRTAVEHRYRFYSYGDAMAIL